ncbi:MAG: pirin family protein [Alphaproteobacteria bacterium]
MISIRRSEERGHFDFGWLDTRHTFSFGEYHDPRFMGFSDLRVVNEDVVAPGAGFPSHPHRDMEILTWVLSGGVSHRDSSGGGGVLRPGELQHMTAGRGIVHSEMNASRTEPLYLLQVWIEPARRGLDPGYAQRAFPPAERAGRLALVASPDGRDGSLRIAQDASLLVATLSARDEVRHDLGPGRRAWVQVARGAVELDGRRLDPGDGAAVHGESGLGLRAASDAEVLVFDLR